MNKSLKLFTYYIMLLFGLIAISWIIWARFIRERTIREIPDYLLTEYRFWVLLYICAIYLYIIKNLIKPKYSNSIFIILLEYFYKPLIILDRSIKYNKYFKTTFETLVKKVVNNLFKIKETHVIFFIILMCILPRIFLVIFLLMDTFYFYKLEIFYKVILIGLLPFFYKYIKYSIKDLLNYWIDYLELHFNFVFIFEKGYEYEIPGNQNTKAIYHFNKVCIKEFISIKYENYIEYNLDKIDYEYIGKAYPHDFILQQYKNKNMSNNDLRRIFEELIELIIKTKIFLKIINNQEEKSIILISKIIIYSCYFICWGFILSYSYYHYPVELNMFKYFINNLMFYISEINEPFSDINLYSKNENLITITNIKELLIKILYKILYIILK